jgi:N-acetylglucosaminyldiphosphoundecaprenol N-acetyl-beta-D-mannosaminyltransferase
MPRSFTFLRTTFKYTTKAEVLEAIDAATSENQVRIATPNPEHLLEAEKNSLFRQVYERMTHCIIDGSGIFILGHLVKHPEPWENYHGSDLAHDLFEKYQNGEKRFFLIGGANPDTAPSAAITLRKKYPHLNIVDALGGGKIDLKNLTLDPELKRQILEMKPDIMFVGFGAPRQEIWMDAFQKELHVPVMIGLGGTFHFYVDRKRAPSWVRTFHFEWLYRMCTEKGHWKRIWRAVIVFTFKSLWWMI